MRATHEGVIASSATNAQIAVRAPIALGVVGTDWQPLSFPTAVRFDTAPLIEKGNGAHLHASMAPLPLAATVLLLTMCRRAEGHALCKRPGQGEKAEDNRRSKPRRPAGDDENGR